MSDDQLKTQLEQCEIQVKGMSVQLNAAREMINENQNAILTLKTNLQLYVQAHNESVQISEKLTKELANCKNENITLLAQNKVLADKVLEVVIPEVIIQENVPLEAQPEDDETLSGLVQHIVSQENGDAA